MLHSVSLSLSILLCLLVVVWAQGCPDPQPASNVNFKQSIGCDVTAPYCVYRGSQQQPNVCAQCQVRGSWIEAGGGSCQCDMRTQYCEQGGELAGTCQPLTKLNDVCADDLDCRTTTRVIVSNFPSITTETRTNEQLFCVFNRCKPCDPSTWSDFVGQIGVATRQCSGYNAALSDRLGRYATTVSRPNYEYTCTNLGDLVVINATINYNLGYPLGDRSLWTPSPSSVPGSSSTPTPSRIVQPDGNATSGGVVAALMCWCWVLMLILW